MDSRIPGQVGAPLGGDPAMAFNTGHSTGIEALEELGVHDVSERKVPISTRDEKDGKEALDEIRYVPADEESFGIGKGMTAAEKVDNMEEIALYALHVDDDPSLNPWTFRTWLYVGSDVFDASSPNTFEFYIHIAAHQFGADLSQSWYLVLRRSSSVEAF
jgi:hypothetical protein